MNGKVVVSAHLVDTKIQVDVLDNGIGIKSEDQSRIFERFFRGEDPLVLATAGTGLGLAIVKNLVEMHHGQIWFTSRGEPGQGSVFSFTLPLQQPGV
jgi:signal transduction histidine kinase